MLVHRDGGVIRVIGGAGRATFILALSLLFTIASAGMAFSDSNLGGVDADPVALMGRVGQNISRLSEISLTTAESRSKGKAKTSRRTYRLFLQENRAEISMGGDRWLVDVNAGVVAMNQGGKEVTIPISNVTSQQSPSLLAFAPLSPSFFFLHEMYGGYVFETTQIANIDGLQAALISGHLSGTSGAGRVELAIELERGLLLVERYYGASGALVRETSFKNYQNSSGSYIPTRVEGRTISRVREVRVITMVENVEVRALGSHASDRGVGR